MPGSARRFVVAVLGVWALMLQSMLPVAGAFAAETGNGFLMELCTTAGLEQVFVGDAPEDQRPTQSKSGAGCDVCVTCGCTTGAMTCGQMAALSNDAFVWTAWSRTEGSVADARHVAVFRSRAPPA